MNLGSSWARARYAFSYQNSPLPEALLVRVPGPGRLLVYQGQTLTASLQSGRVHSGYTLSPIELLGAYPLFRDGHRLLCDEILPPEATEAHEWRTFAWLVYVNMVYAVVNSIRLRGHGGAVIFAAKDCGVVEEEYLRIKYRLATASVSLKQRFVEFMTRYQRYGDGLRTAKGVSQGRPSRPGLEQVRLIHFELQEAQQRLADTCRFIGNMSGADGAILLSTDLSVEGFGAEVLLSKVKPSRVFKVEDPRASKREEFDSEQFGMRHRSAISLSAAVADLVVFVISQDGEVSLVWNDQGQSCFKTGLKTTDVNVVGA